MKQTPSFRKIKLTVRSSDRNSRIDKFLHTHLPQQSRTFYRTLIEKKQVLVNGKFVKPSYLLSEGEIVAVHLPPVDEYIPGPENIPLDVIYEDDVLLVINKPPGMVVHPGAGLKKGTLVNALLYRGSRLSSVGGKLRPGIVHRLDKNTSGLLVIAKNDSVHRKLSKQFSEKSALREYLALVWHPMADNKGRIETHIKRSKRERTVFTVAPEGKKAVTVYEIERKFKFLTLVRVRLHTGRTHQIRIHFNHIHHPVFGDPEYHGRLKQTGQLKQSADRQFAAKLLKLMPRQALHAHLLGFIHPVSVEQMEFQVPLPEDFRAVLEAVKNCKS